MPRRRSCFTIDVGWCAGRVVFPNHKGSNDYRQQGCCIIRRVTRFRLQPKERRSTAIRCMGAKQVALLPTHLKLNTALPFNRGLFKRQDLVFEFYGRSLVQPSEIRPTYCSGLTIPLALGHRNRRLDIRARRQGSRCAVNLLAGVLSIFLNQQSQRRVLNSLSGARA
jgi:hypothetical protein